MSIVMSDQEITRVNKGGTQLVQVNFQRHKLGLYVGVKTAPMIEDLFKSWSGGAMLDCNQHGRLWAPVKPEVKLPQIYHCSVGTDKPFSTDEGRYNLNRTGTTLIDEAGQLNLGFLRFVGSSEGAGVAFVVKGVHEAETIKTRMKSQLQAAVKSFYLQFIRPVDVVITITATEM